MMAMVLERQASVETSPLVKKDLPKPAPGEGEVLIRVVACGVCHTDLHTVEGDLALPLLPIVPGHQVIGKIDKMGSGSTGLRLEQRIGVTWFFSSCGSCKFCNHGMENLCRSAKFTGFHANGGYAEYMTAPASSVFSIPDIFEDAEATPLLCGGVIGYRALKLSHAGNGDSLGLYGFGNSAHIVTQLAVKRGLRVYVFTRSENHRELALDLGATWVGAPSDSPAVLMDASIIFAPSGDLVPVALAKLEKGGTLVPAGITMTNIPSLDYELIYHEKHIQSVANTTREDAVELLAEAERAGIRPVVDKYPLCEANLVLRLMKESRLRAGAALVI
jgi:alcohol dehydrogenase, propanol-preferring